MSINVATFLGGRWLTHLDLPSPYQVWTVRNVTNELVGDDQKIVIYFAEHTKGLGTNKTNLRRVADMYGMDASTWLGKQLLIYRSTTSFQGQTKLCVRVSGPSQGPLDPVLDTNGSAVVYQPAQASPVAAPQQSAAARQPSPWE